MGLIKVSELHKIAEQSAPLTLEGIFDENRLTKIASRKLFENNQSFSISKNYDIFLSHAFDDFIAIHGLLIKLENEGYSVFVDWNEEHFSDRENVSAKRAEELRHQMKNCKCLLFVTSKNSPESIWMPRELGYFDGYKGKVAILPLNTDDAYKDEYNGQEYLGIYPYIKEDRGFLVLIFEGKINDKLSNWVKK